jgi:hypothetical protein
MFGILQRHFAAAFCSGILQRYFAAAFCSGIRKTSYDHLKIIL